MKTQVKDSKDLKKQSRKDLIVVIAVFAVMLLIPALSIAAVNIKENQKNKTAGTKSDSSVKSENKQPAQNTNQTTNQSSPTENSKPQPTQNNSSQQSTSQNSSGQFVAGVCTKTVIPQSTVYEDVSYLYVGETKTYPGIDGWRQTCTASSDGFKPADVVSQGLPTKIYRGTKPRPETTPTPTNTYSYSQALSTAQGQCSPIAQGSGTGSSSYQLCIQTVLKQYGY